MVVTPEAHFITLCLRESGDVDRAAHQSVATAVGDWSRVAALAASHRVAGYVLRATAERGLPVPGPAVAAAEAAAMAAVARALLLDAALRRLLTGLTAAGVPAIVLKGPALARTIYPDPGLRPYGDLDLTVRPEDEGAAVAAVARAGLQEQPFEPEVGRQARAAHARQTAAYHRQFLAPDGQPLLDLHTDPLQLGLPPVCESDRWRRAVALPGIDGALMLCPEDQLVQLSVHAHKHGFSRLIWLKDVDLHLRRFGAVLDWELIAGIAGAEGVGGSVWYTLHLASRLLGAPVPQVALHRLAPSRPLQALYRAIWPPGRIAALAGHMRRRSVLFLPGESWSGMLPSLVVMGRRRDRLRALLAIVLARD